MALRVVNVRGDGHCFYRCVWRVAKECPRVAEALLLEEELSDELEGAMEVRHFVSMSLRHGVYGARTAFRNMLALLEGVEDAELRDTLTDAYPLLSSGIPGSVGGLTDAAEDLRRYDALERIDDTALYASEFEVGILTRALAVEADLRLIVVIDGGSAAESADKWLRELHKMLPTVAESRVALLINVDNVHYRFARFRGKAVASHADLTAYVEAIMKEESDDAEGPEDREGRPNELGVIRS